MSDALTEAKAAYAERAWEEAYAGFTQAGDERHLAPSDLDMLAKAALLTGRPSQCDEMLSKAHKGFMDEGEMERAAECAFWVGFRLMHAGEHARGGGWLARAQRIVDEAEPDSYVRGLLLLPPALKELTQGDAERALEQFEKAHEIGKQFDHGDLLTLSRLGRGQALIRTDRVKEGVTLLDEVMVGVTAGDASPLIVGMVYCAVIDACDEIFDLARAREWTSAFTRWCESEPDVVAYRGECLVRRAEIMQVHGRWSDALEEAVRAGERLSEPPGKRAAGAAFYRQAELHRLRGEFDAAEKAFREGERWGRSPQPGLARLRLMQGRGGEAEKAMRTALTEARDRRSRSSLLPAYVEILLAAGDVEAARAGCDELSEHAALLDAPYLQAIAAYADGSVLLAEGRPQEALPILRRALTSFRELGAPYEGARTLARIGLACRAAGDDDSCKVEIEEARAAFRRLSAEPDLERLDELIGDAHGGGAHSCGAGARRNAAPAGLTPREVEVLELIATGKTNRAIGEELFISEKTVARHVSNIFSKLDVSSRAAATAYAYKNEIV